MFMVSALVVVLMGFLKIYSMCKSKHDHIIPKKESKIMPYEESWRYKCKTKKY